MTSGIIVANIGVDSHHDKSSATSQRKIDKNRRGNRQRAPVINFVNNAAGGRGSAANLDHDHNYDAANLTNKYFVDEYGPLFDAFQTMAYWYGLVDVVVACSIGIIVGTKPPIGSDRCTSAQTVIGVIIAVHFFIGLWYRPWSTPHNCLFCYAFQACLCAMAGVNGWAVWHQNESMQDIVDELDLIVNGLATLKLFFDMMSLLLLPSLGGFFGYIFGSTGYRMMRQSAWESERKRQEEANATRSRCAGELDSDEEMSTTEEPRHDDEAENEEEEEEQEADARQLVPAVPLPNKRYKVVRVTRIIRSRILVKPNATPVATPDASDADANEKDEEQKDDDDDDEEAADEAGEKDSATLAPPSPSPPRVLEAAPRLQGLSSLARFKML